MNDISIGKYFIDRNFNHWNFVITFSPFMGREFVSLFCLRCPLLSWLESSKVLMLLLLLLLLLLLWESFSPSSYFKPLTSLEVSFEWTPSKTKRFSSVNPSLKKTHWARPFVFKNHFVRNLVLHECKQTKTGEKETKSQSYERNSVLKSLNEP